MAFKHTILVTAAGGHIGSELVPQLLQDDVKLVLPTSNANRLRSSLPPTATGNKAIVEEGDISNPPWIETLLKKHNVDRVFLILTGTDELMVTLNFLDAMDRANTVKHLVYLSALGDYVSDEGFRNVVTSCSAMHVLVKPLIERKLRYSQYSWTTTVLGPALFFDNDLRSQHHILNEGLFDEPLGSKGVSRVSTSDIALAAHNTLIDPQKWAGKKLMIGSKRVWNGTEIAKLWSEATGKDVKMCSSDEKGLNEFEEIFCQKSKSRAWARDLRLMYELFEKMLFGMSGEEYDLQVECLGRKPVSDDYEEFVKETGKAWSSSS